jgi:hypothetical protein
LLLQRFLTPPFQLFRAGLEERQPASEEDEQDHRHVDGDRQECPFAAGDGAPDDVLVLVPIVKIEMDQTGAAA